MINIATPRIFAYLPSSSELSVSLVVILPGDSSVPFLERFMPFLERFIPLLDLFKPLLDLLKPSAEFLEISRDLSLPLLERLIESEREARNLPNFDGDGVLGVADIVPMTLQSMIEKRIDSLCLHK
jgi:hypothetical protein